VKTVEQENCLRRRNPKTVTWNLRSVYTDRNVGKAVFKLKKDYYIAKASKRNKVSKDGLHTLICKMRQEGL